MATRLGFAALMVITTTTCATTSQQHTIGVSGAAGIAVTPDSVRPIRSAPPPKATPRETVDIALYDLNLTRSLAVSIPADGRVDEPTAERLRAFFRCRRTHRSRRVDPGLLAMLADIGRRYPGRVIEIMSAYRAPPYGAPRSKHFLGRALDLRVRGIALTTLRDYLWSHHRGTGVGVGYYPGSGFVHLDYRPGQRDATWTQPHKHARYQYYPAWSRIALATTAR